EPSTETTAPSRVWMLPERPVNVPRNVETPRCLTRKPALEWTGSTVHVAVGITAAAVSTADMTYLPAGTLIAIAIVTVALHESDCKCNRRSSCTWGRSPA